MTDSAITAILHAAPYLWGGLEFSLELTAFAFLAGIVLGTAFALIRHARVPILSSIVQGYIALMRSIPLILVLFWFFFLVPILLGHLTPSGRPIPIGPVSTAFITFALFEAAYYAEIVRVGLRAIPKGQFEAAKALALPPFHVYGSIILPQVLRATSPIILSQTIILFQDTSLVYVLSITDLMGAASKLAQLNGHLIELYLTVAVVYLVLSSAASQGVAFLRTRNSLARGRR